MRQLIVSNVVNFVIKKHKKKKKRSFVNTIKESEIVLDVRVRRCVSTKEEEDRVRNVKILARYQRYLTVTQRVQRRYQHQNHQNDHLSNDLLTMLKTGFVQW